MATKTKTQPTGKDKLSAAINAEVEAAATLEKRRRKVRDLMIEDHLNSNAKAKRLTDRILEKRNLLHRLRLAIGRKKYSIRCKEEALAEAKNALAKQEKKEPSLVAEVEQLEKKLEQLKDEIAKQVRAKLKG